MLFFRPQSLVNMKIYDKQLYANVEDLVEYPMASLQDWGRELFSSLRLKFLKDIRSQGDEFQANFSEVLTL